MVKCAHPGPMEFICCEEWTSHGVNLRPMGNGAPCSFQKNFPKMWLFVGSLRSGFVGQSWDLLSVSSAARPVVHSLVLASLLPRPIFCFPHSSFCGIAILNNLNTNIWVQAFPGSILYRIWAKISAPHPRPARYLKIDHLFLIIFLKIQPWLLVCPLN